MRPVEGALAGFHALGTANNVNYGSEAITHSLRELDRLGIAHTGSGANHAAAHAPAIVERKGMRFGVLQRTSVYWPTNHEAGGHSAGERARQILRPLVNRCGAAENKFLDACSLHCTEDDTGI